MKYNVLVFSLCSFPTFYLLNSLVQKFLSAHPVGYRGVSPSVGYRGVSLSVGYRGVSLSVGYRGVSLSVGYRGVSLSTGYRGVSVSVGCRGVSLSVGYRGVSLSVGYRGVSLSVGYRGFSLFVQNAFKVQPRRTVYHIQVFEAYQTEGNFCHELLISFFVMLFILTRSSTYPNPSFSTQLIWIIHYLA